MADLPVGFQIADYRIEAVAGRGGMGVVYRATDVVLDRPVALKLIAPQLAGDAAFRERFLRESRLAAAIDHPNVVSIYRAGEADGQLFLAMRFVVGTDLGRLIAAAGRLEPARATRIVAEVAQALDAAHAQGMVHRDVKPANVLVGADGRVYLGDFGLSKDVASVSGLTAVGQMVGTLDYVAPEQVRGERVDARADVYSLGCVLYEALTGSPPFPQEGPVAKMYGHLHDRVPSARLIAPDLPPALDEVIARATAKEPQERHPSAGDLGRGALAALGETAPPPTERVVAQGDAAPRDRPTEEGVTVPGPATDRQTPRVADTARQPPGEAPAPVRRSGRRVPVWAIALVALVLVGGAAGLVVALVAGDDGEGPTVGSASVPSVTTPTTPTETPPTTMTIETTPMTIETTPTTVTTEPTSTPAYVGLVRSIVDEYSSGRMILQSAVDSVPRDGQAAAGVIANVVLQRATLLLRTASLPDFPGKQDLMRALQLAIEADRAYLQYAATGDPADRRQGDTLSQPVEQAKDAFRRAFNGELRRLGETPIDDF